jgi:4-hydroxy-tetrahydrodipicolinate reductase
VDHVLVRRRLNTNKRRLKLQEKVGVGVDVATFERHVVNGDIGHVGLRTSASLLAEGLGWKLDEYLETIEPVVSKEPTVIGGRTFPAKTVIGQHQVALARTGGREIIRYELDMYADADETDEIVITGIPGVHQMIRGGVNGDIGTEALITNLIPVVASAPHGLITMRDLSRLSCTQNPAS